MSVWWCCQHKQGKPILRHNTTRIHPNPCFNLNSQGRGVSLVPPAAIDASLTLIQASGSLFYCSSVGDQIPRTCGRCVVKRWLASNSTKLPITLADGETLCAADQATATATATSSLRHCRPQTRGFGGSNLEFTSFLKSKPILWWWSIPLLPFLRHRVFDNSDDSATNSHTSKFGTAREAVFTCS